jgi:Domain of unknown function (DUF5076)
VRKDQELAIPPGAMEDPQSGEMLRAWIANGGLHCTLRIGTWKMDEAIAWGILLSDAARHVADALHKESGISREETLAAIRESFDREMESPTSDTQGGFVH